MWWISKEHWQPAVMVLVPLFVTKTGILREQYPITLGKARTVEGNDSFGPKK